MLDQQTKKKSAFDAMQMFEGVEEEKIVRDLSAMSKTEKLEVDILFR